MFERKQHKKKDELGPASAGQSGDLQQLSDVANADSESVEELMEEGNAFEAEGLRASKMPNRPTFLRSKLVKLPKMMYRRSTWTTTKT
jgi:hypothetical protein